MTRRRAAAARSRTRARTARSSSRTASGSASPTSRRSSGRALKLTKGDLLRYYAQVSPLILPAVADRPLVMKRFPNGIDKPAFYQQRSRLEQPPAGVRIETLADDVEPISEPDARRFIGGNLITLLYMTQIAAISQDPWFSRVQSPLDADYVALDLDPGDGTPFSRVLDVARWVRDELRVAARARRAEDVRVARPAHLHPAAAGHVVRIGHAVLPDRRDADRVAASEGRRRSSGWSGPGRAARSTSTTCRTSSARRWRPPTARAPATSPASRRRSAGRSSTSRSIRATSRSRPRRRASPSQPDLWARLRTARPATLEAVFRKYAK